MATQHPDNASSPFWDGESPYVDARREVQEAFECYSQLGCDEYMWDWEGKHVDEAVVERLLEHHTDYFAENQLGKDKFLTFRVPNVWVERGYRIARAFVNIISANDTAADMEMHEPPVFECILPMTTSGAQPATVRKKYSQVVSALAQAELSKEFGLREMGPKSIEVIPLIETPEHMLETRKILSEYMAACEKEKLETNRLRLFIARSDPALNSGIVPAVLGAKACLSEGYAHAEEEGTQVYPIIGVGCLPFRGGFSPETAGEFLEEYEGVYTPTIQSSFRYDYDLKETKKAIEATVQRKVGKPKHIDEDGLAECTKLIGAFSAQYRNSIESIADDVNRIAAFVPSRRERKLHIGLFGYSRQVNGKKLPRAISFTAAMYSLGIPPELVGTGRALSSASAKETDFLEDHYPSMRMQLEFACRHVNWENVEALANKSTGWRKIRQDVAAIEDFLGIKAGPQAEEEYIHRNCAANLRILAWKGDSRAQTEIERAAQLRHSLG